MPCRSLLNGVLGRLCLAGVVVAGVACSKNERALLLVDVTASGMLAPAPTRLAVTAGGRTIESPLSQTLQASAPVSVGIYLDSSGDVTVTVEALASTCAVGRGSTRTTVKTGATTRVAVVLSATPCTGDGGVGDGGGNDGGNDGGDGGGDGGADARDGGGDTATDAKDTGGDAPEGPAAPALLRPWNGDTTGSVHHAANLQPKFRWLPVAGADSYDLELADGCPGFPACELTAPARHSVTVGTSFVPDKPLAVSMVQPVGRRYFWHVRACLAGACGPWSPVRYVDVGRLRDDLDGDGYSELIVGSDQASENLGAVYVFRGGTTPGPTRILTIEGDSAGSTGFGQAVAAVGDTNGDGFADLAIGVGSDDAVLLRLGAAKLADMGEVKLSSPSAEEPLGWRVAAAGDIDADGFADVLASSGGLPFLPGHAVVFFGGAAPSTAPGLQWDIPPDTLSDTKFGQSLSRAGDLDADGFADVLVTQDSAAISQERVYVYRGAPRASIATTPALTLKNGGGFGIAVAGGGDLDGDGYGDFAVSRIGSAQDVFVFRGGSVLDGDSDFSLSDVHSTKLGEALAIPGDLDGDGYDDLVMGLSGAIGTSATDTAGGVRILGGHDPLADGSVRDLVWGGATFEDDAVGQRVAGIGDFDGDGDPEVCASGIRADTTAPGSDEGRVVVYAGAKLMSEVPLASYEGLAPDDEFGEAID